MTADGYYEFTPNAENRRAVLMPDISEPNSVANHDVKVVYNYDYRGRLVRERVYKWDWYELGVPRRPERGPHLHVLRHGAADDDGRQRHAILGSTATARRRRTSSSTARARPGRLAGPASLVAIDDVGVARDLWCYHDAAGKLRQVLDVDVVDDPNYPTDPDAPDGLVARYDYEASPDRYAVNPCAGGEPVYNSEGCDICGECYQTNLRLGASPPIGCDCGDPSGWSGGDDGGFNPDPPGGGETGRCVGPNGAVVYCIEPPTSGPAGGRRSNWGTCEDCDSECEKNGGKKKGRYGTTKCEGGKACYCVCGATIRNRPGQAGNDRAYDIIEECVEKHEQVHVDNTDCTGGPPPPDDDGDNEECEAEHAALKCIIFSLDKCLKNDLDPRQKCRCLRLLRTYVSGPGGNRSGHIDCKKDKGEPNCPAKAVEDCEADLKKFDEKYNAAKKAAKCGS